MRIRIVMLGADMAGEIADHGAAHRTDLCGRPRRPAGTATMVRSRRAAVTTTAVTAAASATTLLTLRAMWSTSAGLKSALALHILVSTREAARGRCDLVKPSVFP
jgi:hypothetical protein